MCLALLFSDGDGVGGETGVGVRVDPRDLGPQGGDLAVGAADVRACRVAAGMVGGVTGAVARPVAVGVAQKCRPRTSNRTVPSSRSTRVQQPRRRARTTGGGGLFRPCAIPAMTCSCKVTDGERACWVAMLDGLRWDVRHPREARSQPSAEMEPKLAACTARPRCVNGRHDKHVGAEGVRLEGRVIGFGG